MAKVTIGWVTQLGDKWIAKVAPNFSHLPDGVVPTTQAAAMAKVQAASSTRLAWNRINQPWEPLQFEGSVDR